MSASLQSTIADLASTFAERLVVALRSMSLAEILAATSTLTNAPARRRPGRPSKSTSVSATPTPEARVRGGRLARRSPEAIRKTQDAIVALLKKNPKGLRAEQIQKHIGLHRKETPRPLGHLLDAKKITRKGVKRSTTYFAVRPGKL